LGRRALRNGSQIEGFAIDYLPPALAVTAGEKHAIGRRRRPVLQTLDQTVRIRAKLRRVADPQAAVWTRLEYRVSPLRCFVAMILKEGSDADHLYRKRIKLKINFRLPLAR
jgi:hypothetical protein